MIKVYYKEEDGTIVATRRDGIEPKGFGELGKLEVEEFDYSNEYLVVDGELVIVEKEEAVDESTEEVIEEIEAI